MNAKILYVGDFRGPSNTYFRFRRLCELGFDVIPFDSGGVKFSGNLFFYKALRRLFPKFVFSFIERNFVEIFKQSQPHLVFVEKGIWLSPNGLETCKRFSQEGTVFVHYHPDDLFRGRIPLKIGGFEKVTLNDYDFHVIPKDKNPAEYFEAGAANVISMDRSYDPIIHRPFALNLEEKERYLSDVGFVGTCAEERASMLSGLAKDDIDLSLRGNLYRNSQHWKVLKRYWRGPGVNGEEYSKAISGPRIVLHFLRRENRDQQDSRTFEIPACGAFMLAQRSSDHERLFHENVEAVFFDNLPDLRRKIKYFLSHPLEREQIGKAGRLRCLSSKYCHYEWFRKIFRTISEHRSVDRSWLRRGLLI